MDYLEAKEKIQENIRDLEKIKKLVENIGSMLDAIELEINSIDLALPSDDAIDAMPDSAERERILDLIDLENYAYSLIEQICGSQGSDAMMPEARGDSGLTIDEILKSFPKNGNAS